jgi:uncharacterized sulfatase
MVILLATSCHAVKKAEQTFSGSKPNILWIMLEDWGPDLSCYGTKGVHTPNIDKLASEGLRYTNARSTSPVCSTSRSAMMTGCHQNYIGAEQHRTSEKKALPNGVLPITQHLKDAGYFTCLMLSKKTDLNFTLNNALVQGKDWKERKKGQPFFAQVTFDGTHRIWARDTQRPIDGKDVEVPPYYPDTALVRRDWANGLEQVQIVDRQVGNLLKRLQSEGLAENTIVFLIGDHGRCHVRGKQFLYEGGIKVPLIVRWSKNFKGNQVRNEHVSAIDVSKTILDLAGVKPTHVTHGSNLFSDKINNRQFTYAARGKMDDTHDAMRAIMGKLSDGKSYKLIHNLMPERAYCQFNWYKERSYPVLTLMNIMNMKGQLNEAQAAFMKASKPDFELFCLSDDPHEIHNLWKKPTHIKQFEILKENLNSWRQEIKDQGVSKKFRAGGHKAKYPTDTLESYNSRLTLWEKWVFRKPGKKARHPFNKGKSRNKILSDFKK